MRVYFEGLVIENVCLSQASFELNRCVSTLGDRCVIVLDWWCVLCCIIVLLSSTHTSGPRDPRVTQCVHLLGNVLLWSLIPNRHRVRTYDLGSLGMYRCVWVSVPPLVLLR